MKKLLNTLYVLSEDAYLALNGETVEVLLDDGVRRIPLHTLQTIVCFSRKGASPALMGKCAEMNIGLTFFTPYGQYLASVSRSDNGNVLLRRQQFRWAENRDRALSIAKNFIAGKLYNAKYVLLRAARDHALQVDSEALRSAAARITTYLRDAECVSDAESLRGVEGNAAAEYFGVFDQMILQEKATFQFAERNRRPPLDPTNALLSFAYVLLANDCASALASVGLDPYVGFLHTDRAGRASLALDLMEELRAPLADRFVLSLINNRVVQKKDFVFSSSGAVSLTDDARKVFLTEWQKRKKQEIVHPFTDERIPWGLVPFVQSMLLARHLREDIDAYPPLFWK